NHKGHTIVADFIKQLSLDYVIGTPVTGAPHMQLRKGHLIAAQPVGRRLPILRRTPGDNEDLVLGYQVLHPFQNHWIGWIFAHFLEESLPVFLFAAANPVQTVSHVGQCAVHINEHDIADLRQESAGAFLGPEFQSEHTWFDAYHTYIRYC